MFELLEHPADIGFRVRADTLPALYANAAVAMLSIATDVAAIEPRETYHLAVASGDRESLMVDWLSEVLYWFDGKRIALTGFEIDRFDGVSLAATAHGEPRDPVRHRANLIVKAVTYHQLRIVEHEGRWLADVYLDI